MSHSDGLLTAIIAGLGAMLGWGFADFFAKKTIDAIGDVTTLFWAQLIGIVPLLALFSIHPSAPAKLWSGGGVGFLYLAALGVWSGLSYVPTYVAFGKGKVSLLSPIFASYAVVVAILSAAVFAEQISIGRWLAFAIVFAGVLLISGDVKALFEQMVGRGPDREPIGGLREILLAIALYSVWLLALDRFINGEYWVPFLLVIRIFSALSLLVYARLRRIKLAVTDPKAWAFLYLIGGCDVAAFAFLSFGYSATSYVSVVTMLSAAFSLPTMVLARLFLHEKTTDLQTVGGLVVIAGVALLPWL
jgi:drug/metabolite transporter (DMT)-like permease